MVAARDLKILIVGAGPTGLTAAVELRRRGFSPRIIDRKDGPSPLSRAIGISAHSLDLLEPAGITPMLVERGYPMHEIVVHENGHVIGRMQMKNIPHRFNFLLSLPQNETEEAMREALERFGGRVDYGHALTSLSIEGDKARVQINDRLAENFDIVIGADGIRSAVRNAAGISFDGYDYPTRWSIADFVSRTWPGTSDVYMLPGGNIRFVVQIGAHRFRIVSNEPESIPGVPGLTQIDETLFADDFIISVRQAGTYQKGPIFLAGDAAHCHSPAGGRGMNLGIEDACDLVERIENGTTDGYTAARHPIGKRWIALSERMRKGFTARTKMGQAVRRMALKTMTAFPALQQPFLRRVAGIKE